MFIPYQLAIANEPENPVTQTRRWMLRVLYVLIVIGCAMRLYDVWIHNPMDHLFGDAQGYWDLASKPLEPSPMALFNPPFFQVWLALAQKFVMGLPIPAAAYAGLMSIVTPWFWYRFLREATSSRLLAVTGWALLVWLPTWIGIYIHFVPETLLLPLLGASLWASMRADRKRTVPSFIGMVSLWLLAALTSVIALPLGVLSMLFVFFHHPHKLRSAAWSALVAILILGPLSYRNQSFVHLWSPFGNGWLPRIFAESGNRDLVLHLTREGAQWEYGFTAPGIGKQPLAPLSDWTPSRSGTVHVYVDLSEGERSWKVESERTTLHGWNLLKMRGENIINVMMGTSSPDDNENYLSEQLSNASRWIWAPLLLLIVAAAAWRWRDTLARPLLPTLIVAWFFLQACSLATINDGRYRKPLEGLLIAQVIIMWDQSRKRTSVPAQNS
ncbi:MAG TPA: hypothetical protein VFW00_10140 [Rhodocyclaceae bacterium]|nr:hypothetical protein [Rhodocyclaceae bacterium]